MLARRVRELGYAIENRCDKKGRDAGFEIGGLSDNLLTQFNLVNAPGNADDAIQEFVKQNGWQPTDNEIAVLIRETRADKLVEISTAEVRRRQQERLKPAEQTDHHRTACIKS